MKKIVALIVFLTSLTCAFSVYAGIDLQPRNLLIVNNFVGNGPADGSYLGIQNNGNSDFQGLFMIMFYTDNHGSVAYSFSGSIKSGTYKTIQLPYFEKDVYSILIDSHYDVAETNENNNYFYYEDGKAQINLVSSWNGLIAQGYRDTLFVLPNEYFYEQFSLVDLNNQKSIIGFNLRADANQMPSSANFYFGIQNLQDGSLSGNLQGGKYSYKLGYNTAECEWMANSSDAALDNFWLGSYDGVARGMAVGSEAHIFFNTNVATNDLHNYGCGIHKMIKIIDRIRGDVNDDGVVDQTDLDILTDVIKEGSYNPCMFSKNMYLERGMNYGAGIVIFGTPDFLSNCLINIWINDHNDPLVQGLGIGELMSKTANQNQGSPIYGVKNSFSISGEDLSIDAPEADLYNVTAQKADGKLFQVTGKLGEQIKVPLDAKNIRVETVKVKQNLTAVTSIKNNINVSVYPNPITDYVNIKSADKGIVKVVNLNGQIIFSAELKGEEELRISASNWANGIYFVNLVTSAGKKTVKVIK